MPNVHLSQFEFSREQSIVIKGCEGSSPDHSEAFSRSDDISSTSTKKDPETATISQSIDRNKGQVSVVTITPHDVQGSGHFNGMSIDEKALLHLILIKIHLD
jgi:hypothetical protein